jgi:hypothetical protein
MKNKKVIIYQAKNGAINFHTDSDQKTIWASQKQLAKVFDVNIRTINEHIENIFKTKELQNNRPLA